jgi:hypothetical protein
VAAEAIVVTPPLVRYRRPGAKPTIFLAGSIEMGVAEQWQRIAIAGLKDSTSVIYNPRRLDWNSDWAQDIESENFNAQVNWELDMIERADYVLFHFDPHTKSPITLAELGMMSVLKPDRMIVSCPVGFWRRGNVEIICERAGVQFTNDLDAALLLTKMQLRKQS